MAVRTESRQIEHNLVPKANDATCVKSVRCFLRKNLDTIQGEVIIREFG